MAQNVGFVVSAKGSQVSPSNASTASVLALNSQPAFNIVNAKQGNRIDVLQNLDALSYAKNGAFFLPLAASTPISVDLTSIITNAPAQAGDGSFATVFDLQFNNLGPNPVTIGNASSNPFLFGLGGTNPTLTIPAGGAVRLVFPAGLGVTSGANSILKFDPGSLAAQIGVAIGGA